MNHFPAQDSTAAVRLYRRLYCLLAGYIMPVLVLTTLFLYPFSEATANGARPPKLHPALRTIGVWVPEINGRLDVVIWYPTTRAPGLVQLDGWTVKASRNARIAQGKYPIILVSHDAAASRMSNHDLAASLAQKGFIVAIPTHPGDNIDDTSVLYRAELLLYRPRHIILALEALLASPELGHLADESRIGLLGIGSGSATMLQIAGAVPEFGNMHAYCASRPLEDPFCTPWAQTNFPFIEEAIARYAGSGVSFTPDIGSFAPPSPEEAAYAREALTAPAQIPPSSPGDPAGDAAPPISEQREKNTAAPDPATLLGARGTSPRVVRAVALMTPGLGPLFTARSLAPVTQPLVIVAAENDSRYPVDRNAGMLRKMLPRIPGFFLAEGCSFADLQAPCPDDAAQPLRQSCASPNPAAMELRKQRSLFLSQFFQQALGSPALLEE